MAAIGPSNPPSRASSFGHALTPFGRLVGSFGLSTVGHFGVLSILSLYLLHVLRLAPGTAGAVMLAVSASFHLSRIFLAPLIDRISSRTAIPLALALCAASNAGLAAVDSVAATLALLFMLGVGYGTNSLAVRALAPSYPHRGGTPSPLLRFSVLDVAANGAAALGPIVANVLFLHWSPRAVFGFAALAYGIAAAVATTLPRLVEEARDRISWRDGIALTVRTPDLRWAMVLTFAAWFLYAQLYATLPVFVALALHRQGLLSTFFALNALLVIALQLPVSHVCVRLGLRPRPQVQAGFIAFAGGFALLWAAPAVAAAYAAIVFWTFGEMLVMPAIDTLVAGGAPRARRVLAFGLNSVGAGLGEGAGNLFGVALAGLLLRAHEIRSLYGLFTATAVAAAATAFVAARRPSPATPAEASENLHSA